MNGLLSTITKRNIAFGLATVFSIFVLAGFAGLRINTTSSLPKGIYFITGETKAPLVEFCPPVEFLELSSSRGYRPPGNCGDGAAPLLKPVIANLGDSVALSIEGIRVNGRLLPNTAPLQIDSAGRPLAAWPSGVYNVGTENVWVASSYNSRSFDSRYFGPVPIKMIRHRLKPIWILRSANIGH